VTSQQQLFIGIDGGGTKCKARIVDAQGQLLGEGIAGPANPVRDLQQTFDSIIEATESALKQAGFASDTKSSLIAGIGLAGVNLPKYKAKVEAWQHPFNSMTLTTDLHIACLGAHKGEDGAVIITGTGFCAGYMIANNYNEIGGHGFLLGEQGSGARLGAAAINKALEVLDGIAERNSFIEGILEQLGCQDAISIVEKTVNAKPSFFAQFAPLVFKHARLKDKYALEIVYAAADYISRMARRLLSEQPPRLSMIGGIAEPIAHWLDEDIQLRLSAPLAPPEAGAILLAQQIRIK
jgi:glucosamine kinase